MWRLERKADKNKNVDQIRETKFNVSQRNGEYEFSVESITHF